MGSVSGRGWCLIAVGLVALVLGPTHALGLPAPGEPAPPTIVTLYAHWHDVVNRAPLNTIPPDPSHEPDINQGFQMPTVVVRSPCGEACDVTFQNNVFSLYTYPRETPLSAASEFHIDNPAYDVELGDGPIVAYVYLSAHPVPSLNSTGAVGELTNAGLMPLVRVDARWETGHELGLGIPIAYGATPDTINMIYVPGGDPVYEIVVPMGRYIDTIPAGVGTLLTVRIHQVAADNLELQQSNWRLRSGPDYPWRVTVPVDNAIVKRDLQAWLIDGQAHVRWGVKAAFGAYDFDASTFQLNLASGEKHLVRPPSEVLYSSLRDPEVRTVYAHWVIPVEELAGGERWTIQTSVQNRQHSTGLDAQTHLTVAPFVGSNRTPGFEVAVALGVAALAALSVRRRGAF